MFINPEYHNLNHFILTHLFAFVPFWKTLQFTEYSLISTFSKKNSSQRLHCSIYKKRFGFGRKVKLILFLRKYIFTHQLRKQSNHKSIVISKYHKNYQKRLLIESFHQKRIYNLPQGFSLKHKYPFIFICELSKP